MLKVSIFPSVVLLEGRAGPGEQTEDKEILKLQLTSVFLCSVFFLVLFQFHIGAPGYLVTNLVKHLVTNLVIHWILWSIWWQYWWHILWGTKFVTIFGEHSITLFGDSLKLSPYLVTFLSHNLSLNQFTKFFTKYCTNCFPMFRDNSVTISVLTNFSQN